MKKLEGWIAIEENCLWVACEAKSTLRSILRFFEKDGNAPFKGEIKKITIRQDGEEENHGK